MNRPYQVNDVANSWCSPKVVNLKKSGTEGGDCFSADVERIECALHAQRTEGSGLLVFIWTVVAVCGGIPVLKPSLGNGCGVNTGHPADVDAAFLRRITRKEDVCNTTAL